VLVVPVVAQSVRRQALRHAAGVVVGNDDQGTRSARAVADAVERPRAASAGGTVSVALLAHAVLVPVLGVGALRHAVRPVARITTIVAHVGTLCAAALPALSCNAHKRMGVLLFEITDRLVSKQNLHTHPFNGPLSGTTRVSRYQKGKTI